MVKIYTKTGDKGTSSLFGGTRVKKYHERLECYGTIDELNAHIGLIIDESNDKSVNELLITIQNILFVAGAYLANENPPENSGVNEQHIQLLETQIDTMTQNLPELKNFILPSGHILASRSHVCRTICRRAERHIVRLADDIQIDERIIKFINRLSDFFFVLARKYIYDNGKQEICWKTNVVN